jgi:hypothetical protein
MTEMIERVARAMCDERCDWGCRFVREYWITAARAAIEAMREPTDAMLEFRLFFGSGEACQWAPHVWRAMIDAALGEKQ